MAVKREYPRHIKKLPAEVRAGDLTFKGTTVRLSEKGFFIRSQQSFQVGTPVEIMLHLAEESICRLRGVVRYSKAGDLFRRENGMGIEVTVKDAKYLEFIRVLEEERG